MKKGLTVLLITAVLVGAVTFSGYSYAVTANSDNADFTARFTVDSNTQITVLPGGVTVSAEGDSSVLSAIFYNNRLTERKILLNLSDFTQSQDLTLDIIFYAGSRDGARLIFRIERGLAGFNVDVFDGSNNYSEQILSDHIRNISLLADGTLSIAVIETPSPADPARNDMFLHINTFSMRLVEFTGTIPPVGTANIRNFGIGRIWNFFTNNTSLYSGVTVNNTSEEYAVIVYTVYQIGSDILYSDYTVIPNTFFFNSEDLRHEQLHLRWTIPEEITADGIILNRYFNGELDFSITFPSIQRFDFLDNDLRIGREYSYELIFVNSGLTRVPRIIARTDPFYVTTRSGSRALLISLTIGILIICIGSILLFAYLPKFKKKKGNKVYILTQGKTYNEKQKNYRGI